MSMLYFLLGFLVGIVSLMLAFKSECIGYLRLDKSDPDENPYLFLELDTNIGTIGNKKYIALKVKTEDFIAR